MLIFISTKFKVLVKLLAIKTFSPKNFEFFSKYLLLLPSKFVVYIVIDALTLNFDCNYTKDSISLCLVQWLKGKTLSSIEITLN